MGFGKFVRSHRQTLAGTASEPSSGAQPPADPSVELEALLASRQAQRYEIERWRAAFDALPDACLIVNPAGRVQFANRAAQRLVATAAPAVEASLEVWLRAAGITGDGPWREGLVDDSGRERGELVLLQDPGTPLRAQTGIAEFLSHISHELKSPLHTIRSYAEMLHEGSIDRDETRREFFNVITEESRRLAKLIDNLLDLSKIDSGALVPQRARTRVDAILQELLRAADAPARAKRIDLVARIPTNLPTAFADKDLVGVALSNLISNAIKYTPEGGRVEVRAQGDAEALVVEVEDSGIGIQPEDRKNLFRKFFRGSSAEVRKQPGTGLGLALSHQIVQLHGGTLTVDSVPGKGSTFRVSLPVGERELREAFGLPESSG